MATDGGNGCRRRGTWARCWRGGRLWTWQEGRARARPRLREAERRRRTWRELLATRRGAVNARTTRGRGRGVLLLLDAEAEEEGAAAQELGGRRRAALGVRRCVEGWDGTKPADPRRRSPDSARNVTGGGGTKHPWRGLGFPGEKLDEGGGQGELP